jgi:small subunit ribosomal protein S16
MLTIRLTRKGKKNQPFFRVVVIDKKRSSKGGRAVEDLGYVDPLKKRRSFKKERILYWISKGAKASATIHNLLVSEKIIDSKKIHVSRLSKKAKEAAAKKVAEAQAAAPTTAPESMPAPAEAQKDLPAPVTEDKGTTPTETSKEEPKP